ncbi:MAG TPA: aminopeptidase P family N-terminal domain-containing protein, partial [Ktedonobacteraceae bacterium]|nr:aminopeptidase P family N-terminal domain-containing protein [Ktedonobacteraceae bacterium]
MPETRVELAEIVLPEFGLPREEPTIPAATYEARIAAVRQRASDAGYDVLMVYADREHFANLAYLTGFDPRFEEALLILAPDRM